MHNGDDDDSTVSKTVELPETACHTTLESSVAVAGGDGATDIEILKSVPAQFAVTDRATANWLVRRVVEARRYGQSVKEWSAQELRRAEREERTLLFLYGNQIEVWAKAEIEKLNGRRKSVSLPAGTLSFRRQNPTLMIQNESAVMEWARSNCPNAVQSTERLLRSVVKEHFNMTGEIPDCGAYVEQEKEKFSIT